MVISQVPLELTPVEGHISGSGMSKQGQNRNTREVLVAVPETVMALIDPDLPPGNKIPTTDVMLTEQAIVTSESFRNIEWRLG
jgi:hypothetical protein